VRLDILAVGRLKAGPERALVDDYLDRASVLGRSLGLGPAGERELDPRHYKDKMAETQALASDLEPGALAVALDETGQSVSSLELARILQTARDDGARQAVFLIGGADGHAREHLPANVKLISFGRATWPHKLVRAMLAEQLYRAVSILAGTPYHREG
jgi:23S rRNA (pseudouridine1915-N3)-methyltransferase